MADRFVLFVFLLPWIVLILYLLFSKITKPKCKNCKENTFLRSESTNSYYKAKVIYENLQKDEHKAHFKGDHIKYE